MIKKNKFFYSCLAFLLCVLTVSFLFTIPKAKCQESAYAKNIEYVYLGGVPIGIEAEAESFTVAGLVDVVTVKGTVSPSRDSGLIVGDIILSINDVKFSEYTQILDTIKNNSNSKIKFTINRGGNLLDIYVQPVEDLVSKEMKLGLHLRKGISGVGTLTYIKPMDFRYGGLGHPIFSGNENEKSLYSKGKIYSCSIVGVEKGAEGKAGELKGAFSKENPIGNIDKNLFSGIFGYTTKETAEQLPKILVGNRSIIRTGEAYIYTTVQGNKPEKYTIEIVKVNNSATEQAKNLIIRIKDDRLIEKTGGIVQGMSGSPIVQNNRIIGAVTHVFVNDPKTGYGIFIDWMLNK